MKVKALTCFFFDSGKNKKIFKFFNKKDLEDYIYNISKKGYVSYINKQKISLYDKNLNALITIEILTKNEDVYKYMSAGNYRRIILLDIVNDRL